MVRPCTNILLQKQRFNKSTIIHPTHRHRLLLRLMPIICDSDSKAVHRHITTMCRFVLILVRQKQPTTLITLQLPSPFLLQSPSEVQEAWQRSITLRQGKRRIRWEAIRLTERKRGLDGQVGFRFGKSPTQQCTSKRQIPPCRSYACPFL